MHAEEFREKCAGLCNMILFFKLFIYWLCGVLAAVQAFSSCDESGLLFVVVHASPFGGFSCCGAQALGTWDSVIVAHWLRCSETGGIFLDQGLNLRPLS